MEGQEKLAAMAAEMKEHLLRKIIPFWRGLRDDEYGGYYGGVSYDLEVDKKAEKGCILNSRITWFFSNAYTLYRQGFLTECDCKEAGFSGMDLLNEASHGYAFLKDHCMDKKHGGVYWSLAYDGQPLDTTKHTYNQAFSIYALSSYCEASGNLEALVLAYGLFHTIEEQCVDDVGYLEAFTEDFRPESNEKLSENGVMADKTMNTLLHVLEAYTELYRVTTAALAGATLTPDLAEALREEKDQVRERLCWIMDTFADKVYNPTLQRQEVFFNANYETILDLHSYGHDIETSWLMDRTVEILGDAGYEKKLSPITEALRAKIYEIAFNGSSLANECDRGVVNTRRIWWVQAETAVGFVNGWQKDPSHEEYLQAALAEWEFIKIHQTDAREGSEWFWEVEEDGSPVPDRPIVEPWKCPYHNGRMCMEIVKRAAHVTEK